MAWDWGESPMMMMMGDGEEARSVAVIQLCVCVYNRNIFLLRSKTAWSDQMKINNTHPISAAPFNLVVEYNPMLSHSYQLVRRGNENVVLRCQNTDSHGSALSHCWCDCLFDADALFNEVQCLPDSCESSCVIEIFSHFAHIAKLWQYSTKTHPQRLGFAGFTTQHTSQLLIHNLRGCFTLTTDREKGCSAQYPFVATGKDCHKGQGPVSIGWNVCTQTGSQFVASGDNARCGVILQVNCRIQNVAGSVQVKEPFEI